ncbi:MAG: hypothetical protein JNK67_26745 [Alphaproteobacteria bacterium]|nr:hypothetical protein [Alphaproteobacteria bacterium]
MDEGRRGERLIGTMLLAVLLFSPAIMAAFASPARVFGLPLLLVYVFAAWAVVVALLARIAAGGDRGRDER